MCIFSLFLGLDFAFPDCSIFKHLLLILCMKSYFQTEFESRNIMNLKKKKKKKWLFSFSQYAYLSGYSDVISICRVCLLVYFYVHHIIVFGSKSGKNKWQNQNMLNVLPAVYVTMSWHRSLWFRVPLPEQDQPPLYYSSESELFSGDRLKWQLYKTSESTKVIDLHLVSVDRCFIKVF